MEVLAWQVPVGLVERLLVSDTLFLSRAPPFFQVPVENLPHHLELVVKMLILLPEAERNRWIAPLAAFNELAL